MTESVPGPSKEKAAALTKARLEAVLRETREDEAKLRKTLEMRRLRRRLDALEAKRK